MSDKGASASGGGCASAAVGEEQLKRILRFLRDYWSKLLIFFAVSIFSIWVFAEYRSSQRELVQDYSFSFSKAQGLYSDLFAEPGQGASGEDAKEVGDDVRILEENLRLLHKRGTVYGGFASLYLAALYARRGEYGRVADYLDSCVLSSSASSPALLVEELNCLLYAKVKLSAGELDEAVAILEKLVMQARFVNVEALVSLSRLSMGVGFDRRAVVDLAHRLVDLRPEHREQVEAELEKLGES